ncbi:MAG: AMP-binding protein, partial [Comamonas sp.]
MSAHHTSWPSRLPHSITVPATSVWENLAINARRYPDKAALVFLGRSTSYRELCEGTERMAAYLHGLGVKQGDRVIVLMQNTSQLVLAHYAIFR